MHPVRCQHRESFSSEEFNALIKLPLRGMAVGINAQRLELVEAGNGLTERHGRSTNLV